MKIKYYSLAMLAAVFATSCSNEEVVETNADPIGEAIDFRPSVGTTRAVSTTISNLGDFNVYAKGIHATSGSLYKSFLVGDNTTGAPDVASRITLSGDNGRWGLKNNVYWPSEIDKALFWAFSDRHTDETTPTNGKCVDGTVKFNDYSGPSIENYTPVKADLTKEVVNDQGWYDGDNQRDLVSAFCQQTKNPHVTLAFHHLLSQIEITARSKRQSEDKNNSRNVKIKGAWLVNICPRGTLAAGFAYDQQSQTATDKPSWDPVNTANQLQSYGTFYVNNREVPVDAQGTTTNPLNVLGINGRGNLMMIPQKMEQWDGLATTTSGTYLLLLCRVELQHAGDVVVEPGEPIKNPNDETGYHYHQLFPIMDEFDDNAYGFSAIALPVNWEIGKKYTYSLDMCGDNTGAGKYPPNIPTDPNELNDYLNKFIPESMRDEITIVTERPGNKKVGDYVLDEPIQFNVSVSDWDNGGEWTNGSDTPTTPAVE